MKRRDFLLLRPSPHARLLELSCGRLYMRYLEARDGAPAGEPYAADDPRGGEPPSELDTRTTEALFGALAEDLHSADVVRLTDRGWLADSTFRAELDRVLDEFRAHGGRVEMPEEKG